MGPSKSPTKAEKAWMDKVSTLDCVACLQDGWHSQSNVHHITQGGRRLGHLFTIPLCPDHHKSDGRQVPSIHHQKRTFVARYGGELELLAALKKRLGVFDEARYEA